MSHAADELMAQAVEAKKSRRFDLARAALVRAVELLRRESDPLALAQALRELGEVERSLPDTDGGIGAYEEAVAIFQQHGAELKLAHTVRHLADIHRHGRRVEEADRCYQMALDLYRKYTEASTLDVANALRGAALLKELDGDTEQAIALWSEATRLYEKADIAKAVDEGSRRLAHLREKVAQNEIR